MAAFYVHTFDCGYQAKVKGSSHAASHESYERYVNIFMLPKAKKMHREECSKCT